MPAPDRIITFHAVAARQNTTDKVPVFCKCKDKRGWCLTRRCACIKAEVKCGVEQRRPRHREQEGRPPSVCPNRIKNIDDLQRTKVRVGMLTRARRAADMHRAQIR